MICFVDKVILYTDICGSQRFTAPETRRFNDKLLNLGIVLYYLVIFHLFIYTGVNQQPQSVLEINCISRKCYTKCFCHAHAWGNSAYCLRHIK
jgi:hypothetical protein